MAIFRVEKTKDYTVMSNYHLRDKNLTLKAKGLLSWMLSNTEGWDYSVNGIVAVMKENRDAICSALAELEDFGYLTRRKIRDGGKFGGVEYLITEVPFTENPNTVNPITENPQQINTNINKELKETGSLPKGKEEQAPPKSYKEVFEDSKNKYIREALEKFIRNCNGRNIRFRVNTVERFASTLRDNAGEDPALAMAMVNQSIDNGWKDIYPLKKSYTDVKKKGEAVSTPVSKEEKAKNEDGSYVVY